MVRVNDFPPLTAEQLADIEYDIQEGKEITRRGEELFNQFFDELQQYPTGTLVSINTKTSQYYITPFGRNDVSMLVNHRPPGENRKGYWTCRLQEGRDGKKYAGGVYSVGQVQTHAHAPHVRGNPIHRHD